MGIDVSIVIFTYNQERFIEETLRSVFSQKTNLSIQVVIGEDASKDNTRNVILDFLKTQETEFEVTTLFRSENLGMCGNYFDAIDHCKGKYIAQISGDDYWMDSEKIQKQFDFLEAHPDFTVCFTHFSELIENDDRNFVLKEVELDAKDIFTHDDVVKENPVIAGTSMFRNDMMHLVPTEAKNLGCEDWPVWWYYSMKGPIKKLDITGLAYRKHNTNFYIARDWAWMRWFTLNVKKNLVKFSGAIDYRTFLKQDWSKVIHVLTSDLEKAKKRDIIEIINEVTILRIFMFKFYSYILPDKLFIIYFKLARRLIKF